MTPGMSSGCMTPQAKTNPRLPGTPQPKSETNKYVLPPQPPGYNKKTLVLDLDETLVHSAFQPVDNVDLVLPVEIEGVIYYVYVLKRPGVEDFLQCVSKYYEVVIFTASLSKYADPLISLIDPNHYAAHRLFREHCVLYNNSFVKDLTTLGRKMENIIIVDNSPNSYLFQPQNALPIQTWIDDFSDKNLYELIPILEALANVKDVRKGLSKIVKDGKIDYVEALKALKMQREETKPVPKINTLMEPEQKLMRSPRSSKPQENHNSALNSNPILSYSNAYCARQQKMRCATPGIPTQQESLSKPMNSQTQANTRPGSSTGIRQNGPPIGINSPKAKTGINMFRPDGFKPIAAADAPKLRVTLRTPSSPTSQTATNLSGSSKIMSSLVQRTEQSIEESAKSAKKSEAHTVRNRGNSARNSPRKPAEKVGIKPSISPQSEKLAQLYSNILSKGFIRNESVKKSPHKEEIYDLGNTKSSLMSTKQVQINLSNSKLNKERFTISSTIQQNENSDFTHHKTPFTPTNGRNSIAKNLLVCGTPKGKRALSVKKETNTMTGTMGGTQAKENSKKMIGNLMMHEKLMVSTSISTGRDTPWKLTTPSTTRNSNPVILKPGSKKAY